MRALLPLSIASVCLFGCAQLAQPDDWPGGIIAASSSGGAGATGAGGDQGGLGGAAAGGVGGCVETDSNPDHCGACDHSCLGGECVSGQCQPVIVSSNPGLPYGHLALDGHAVYWSAEGRVLTLDKKAPIGTEPDTLVGPEAGADMLVSAPDAIYWSGYLQGVIGRYQHTVGRDELLTEAEPLPFGIDVDGDELVWVQSTPGGEVRTMATNGAGGPTTLATPQNVPVVAVKDGDHVFYTHRSSSVGDGGVLTAGGLEVATGQKGPSGLAVTPTHAYWITYDGFVRRAPKQGGGVVETIAGPYGGGYYVGEVALDATHVYWTGPGKHGCDTGAQGNCACEPNCGKVFRAPLAGGAAEVVAEGPWEDVGCLAVDLAAVYWMTGSPSALIRKAK